MESYMAIRSDVFESGTGTPEKLLTIVKNGAVLLELRPDTTTHECSVRSYAFNYRNELYVYAPGHYLAGWMSHPEGWDTLDEEEIQAENQAAWREKYLDPDTWISIDEEFFNQADLAQVEVLLDDLAKGDIELYLSDDIRNFYGPLECEFIDWWLLQHPDYHVGYVPDSMNE